MPKEDDPAFQAVLRAGCLDDAKHAIQLERFVADDVVNRAVFTQFLGQVASYLRCSPALYADAAQLFRQALPST